MNKLTLLLRNNQRFLPLFVIGGAIILSGSAAYTFSPQGPFNKKQAEAPAKTVSYQAKPTQTVTPTSEVSNSPEKVILGSQTATPTQPVPTVTQSTATGGTSPTNTPVAQQATSTPTQTPQAQSQAAATVAVEIKSPDGSSSFTVEYTDGMNVCDVLQKAKDTGKITSVTFDDSYMSTLKSKYVAEINGHANNWTFTINGSQPLGCSLANPKPNDVIVWKFG